MIQTWRPRHQRIIHLRGWKNRGGSMNYWDKPSSRLSKALHPTSCVQGLTILGIVIGWEGGDCHAQYRYWRPKIRITGSINGLGTNLLFCFLGKISRKAVRNVQPSHPAGCKCFAGFISKTLYCNVASGISGNLAVTYNGQTDNASITGSTANYAEVRN